MNRKIIAALLIVWSANAVAQGAAFTGRLADGRYSDAVALGKQVHIRANLVQLSINGQGVYGYMLPGSKPGQATLIEVSPTGEPTLSSWTISADQAQRATPATGTMYVGGRAVPPEVNFTFGALTVDGAAPRSGYEFAWGGGMMFMGVSADSGALIRLTDAQRRAFVPA